MQAIAEFLKAIGDAILGVYDFVISLFQDLVFMVRMLGDIGQALPVYFSWLPSSVLSALILVFTLVILYKFLGREG